jgi:hypothetical protein
VGVALLTVKVAELPVDLGRATCGEGTGRGEDVGGEGRGEGRGRRGDRGGERGEGRRGREGGRAEGRREERWGEEREGAARAKTGAHVGRRQREIKRKRKREREGERVRERERKKEKEEGRRKGGARERGDRRGWQSLPSSLLLPLTSSFLPPTSPPTPVVARNPLANHGPHIDCTNLYLVITSYDLSNFVRYNFVLVITEPDKNSPLLCPNPSPLNQKTRLRHLLTLLAQTGTRAH